MIDLFAAAFMVLAVVCAVLAGVIALDVLAGVTLECVL